MRVLLINVGTERTHSPPLWSSVPIGSTIQITFWHELSYYNVGCTLSATAHESNFKHRELNSLWELKSLLLKILSRNKSWHKHTIRTPKVSLRLSQTTNAIKTSTDLLKPWVCNTVPACSHRFFTKKYSVMVRVAQFAFFMFSLLAFSELGNMHYLPLVWRHLKNVKMWRVWNQCLQQWVPLYCRTNNILYISWLQFDLLLICCHCVPVYHEAERL